MTNKDEEIKNLKNEIDDLKQKLSISKKLSGILLKNEKLVLYWDDKFNIILDCYKSLTINKIESGGYRFTTPIHNGIQQSNYNTIEEGLDGLLSINSVVK